MRKKYDWIGDQINPEGMEKLHHLSKRKKPKPITYLVRDAVRSWVKFIRMQL